MIEEHSGIISLFEDFCKTRRDAILSEILETDDEYKLLYRKRTEASKKLSDIFAGTDVYKLLESYSDAIYAQEIYELNVIYMQALHDFLKLTREQLRE